MMEKNGGRGLARRKQLQERAQLDSLLRGLVTETDSGLLIASRIDADVDLVALLPCALEIQREQSFSTCRDGRSEGAAQAGFADVEANPGYDSVAENQVHAAVRLEAGESIEEIAHGARKHFESLDDH